VGAAVVAGLGVARKGSFTSSGGRGDVAGREDRYASGSAGTGGEADGGYSV
jgi:hypothetical protein